MARCIYAMLIATALALALVWQGAEVRSVGYELEELREQVAEQKALSAIYEAHLSKLKSPQRVTALVAWLGLDLEEPVPPAAAGGTAVALNGGPVAPAARPLSTTDAGAVAVAAAPGF